MNISNILEGEVNIDHLGVKRWRVTCEDNVKYYSKEELERIFNSYIEDMESIIEDLK